MNDAKLIFVSPYFQFCLRADVVMVAPFSFVTEGIKKKTLEWFQCKLNYYSLTPVCKAISFGLI